MHIATEAHSFLTVPTQIKAWLKSMGIKGCKTNGDGLVDVQGDIDLEGKLGKLKSLPVRFGMVSGYFSCEYNQLLNLEGVPKAVGGSFCCQNNQLVSLEGAPKKIGGDFLCYYNQLVSLEGAPEQVGGSFHCHHNQLVSLEGAPKEVGGDFHCDHNQLTSLEGAPAKVGGDLHCGRNLLVDFKGLEGLISIGGLFVTDPEIGGQDNVFVSLEGLPKELYNKVVGLDIPFVLELAKKRAASLLDADEEELISEIALG